MKKNFTFKEGILNFLIHTPKIQLANILQATDSSDRSGIPVFFYRYPLYTNRSRNRTNYITEDYGFEINTKFNTKHLEILEFLFEIALYEENAVKAECTVSSFLQLFDEIGIGILGEMTDTRFTITQDQFSKTNFPLFSSVSYLNEKIHIAFSDEISTIFLIDYLLPTKKIKPLFKKYNTDNFQPFMIRYVLTPTAPLSNGMRCDTISDRIGINENPINLNKMAQMMIKEKEFFDEFGINFEMQGHKFKYAKGKYAKSLHVKPKLTREEALSIKEPSSPATANEEVADKKGRIQIDFLNAKLTTQMRDKALDMGYANKDIDTMFTLFTNSYSQLTRKYYDLSRAWGSYLKNCRTHTRVDNASNRGSAENITLNNEICEISDKYDLSKEDEIEMFTTFRNYYISNEVKKKNWLPIWENWIITGLQRKSKNTYKDKTKLETDFYVATLVSKDIEIELESHGISLGDIVSGKKKVNNVKFRNYPLPPSVGKGETTVFSWSDPTAQASSIAKYLKDGKKTAAQYLAIQNKLKAKQIEA